ncbi:MAG: DUF3298 and DUF4163 domain-containing protein [Anaerolineae bacterium]|nr:DUF3298 and DUF4163 domain-containing protein [Anaerolineae bacterium]
MRRMMIAAALCALCLMVGGISAQADDQCLQKGGNLGDDGKCILSATLNMSVDYPLELAQDPLIANTIDPYIQQAKNDLLQFLMEGFSPGSAQYALDITYETSQYSDTILTLIFTTYQYSGGAHGSTIIQTYTFDLANQNVIHLDDLFTNTGDALALIAPLVTDDLTEKLGDMLDAGWLAQGSGTDPQNYQTFSLTPDSIIFYFQQYQVAAYAAGIQQVTIPLSALGSVLAPDFAS